MKDNETIIIGGLISRDLKDTEYKVPYLNKIPLLGKKLFTSSDVIEKKTDLIIQITPSVILPNMEGIVKTDEMIEFENRLKEEIENSDLETEESEAESTPESNVEGESDAK